MRTSNPARIPVWIGLAGMAGWLLSYICPKRQRSYKYGNDQGKSHHRMARISRSERPKDEVGLWSLALELLGAIAIKLVHGYFKSWSSALIVRLKSPAEPELSSAVPFGKTGPKNVSDSPGYRPETTLEKVAGE